MEQVKEVPQQFFPFFMQRKGPLASLKKPTNSPHPEPHELSTHPFF
jgi:hypothetical protein